MANDEILQSHCQIRSPFTVYQTLCASRYYLYTRIPAMVAVRKAARDPEMIERNPNLARS